MTDVVLRAMTDDNSFRRIAARTTETVRGVLARQQCSGTTARYFGDLLTAAVLIRETMAPLLRVQLILKGATGCGSLIADSHPDGGTRGLVQVPVAARPFELGPGALLHAMRTMYNRSIQQGFVDVPASKGVSGALMSYLAQSEQIASIACVSTVFRGDELVVAGGYLMQLLPEADPAVLDALLPNVESAGPIDTLLTQTMADPSALLTLVTGGQSFTLLEQRPVAFACPCNEVRLLGSLATLPREDIEEMIRDGATIEIGCDFCGTQYHIQPEQLRGLLQTS